MIKKCNKSPDILPIEKLRFITKYNPYYIEEKYLQSKVDVEIFDSFDLNKINDEFIRHFRENNFERIFQKYLYEYIKKLIDKIKNIPNIDTVIKLININNLSQKSIFLDPLNKCYDNIISKELEFLSTDEKLKEAYHIIAKLAIINYHASYSEKEKTSEVNTKKVKGQKDKTVEEKIKRPEKDKKFNFINKRIKELDKKLSKKISPLIFIEIINILFNKEDKNENEECEENEENDNKENKGMWEEEYDKKEFNDMKEFIFSEFSQKLDDKYDIDNIIKLIDCLKGKDKKTEDSKSTKEKQEMINDFLTQLISKKLFTKDEFFKNETQNLKISLIIELYDKNIIREDGEYYEKIKELLDAINKDLGGEIEKSKLDNFLKNKESIVKERLGLIKKIMEKFDPEETYKDLKKTNDKINENIEKLHTVKDNIIIYFKDSYKEKINEIKDEKKKKKNKRL